MRLYDASANILKGEFAHRKPVLDCCFHDDSSGFSASADRNVCRYWSTLSLEFSFSALLSRQDALHCFFPHFWDFINLMSLGCFCFHMCNGTIQFSVRLHLSSEVYASLVIGSICITQLPSSFLFHWELRLCQIHSKPCFLHKDPLAVRSRFLCLRLFYLYSIDNLITVMVGPLSCTDMGFPKRLQWAIYNSNQSLICLLILWVLQIWLQHWKRGPLGDTWGTCAVCRIFTCNR